VALGPHQGHVSAVCAGSKQPGCANPIATGSSSGELCIWDGLGFNQYAKIDVGHPVLAIHWPNPGTIILTLGQEGGKAWMERIIVSTLDDIKKSDEALPLSAKKSGPSDVLGDKHGDAMALLDNKDLCLWCEDWETPLRYSNSDTATAVAIDPHRRYVAVGEKRGTLRIWWGALDREQPDQLIPGRWQWHAGPIRALAHSGPYLLTAGDEGVLCIRNLEDETTSYIPRFSAGFRHLCVSKETNQICCSLQDNSFALLESLHGMVRPRYIPGIDHSLSEPWARKGTKRKHSAGDSKDGKRAKGQPVKLLHSLEGGMVVASRGRRVTFLKGSEEPEPGDTFELSRGGTNRDPRHCWELQQLVLSSNGSCIMTCEGRIAPALEMFDPSSAYGCLLKWWRRDAAGEYILDSVSSNPHRSDVLVGIANPAEETIFFTASKDSSFKIWDHIEAPSAPETKDGETPKCWQAVARGSWRRPLVSGCFSPDGSVVAAGLCGSILLMKADDCEVTDLLKLEASDTPKQMCSVVFHTCLLIACVEGKTKEEIVCWDLISKEVVTKLDLTTALPGEGSVEMRCAWHRMEILAFRSGEASFSTWCLEEGASNEQSEPKKVSFERQIGQWSALNLTFVEQASGRLPEGTIEDMAFHFVEDANEEYEHSVRPSLMCWTSCGLLWNLDLSGAEQPEIQRAEEVVEETAASALGGFVSGRMAVSKSETKSMYPIRTTAAQQAGLVPRLLHRILPPQVPSHLLPAPAVLWRDFLSIYAKPAKVEESASMEANTLPFASLEAQFPASEALPSHAELVDEAWMDSLVEAM